MENWTTLDIVNTFTRAELLAGMRPNLDCSSADYAYRIALATACRTELTTRALDALTPAGL